MNKNEQILTMKDVTALLNISRTLLEREIKKGKIRYMRIGTLYRFRMADVINYMNECQKEYCERSNNG